MPIICPTRTHLLIRKSSDFFRCHRYYALRLGCTYFNLDPAAPRAPAHDTYRSRVLPKDAFVYVVHAVALALFGLFFAHVQVSERDRKWSSFFRVAHFQSFRAKFKL